MTSTKDFLRKNPSNFDKQEIYKMKIWNICTHGLHYIMWSCSMMMHIHVNKISWTWNKVFVCC
jgi:hypothetical protein